MKEYALRNRKNNLDFLRFIAAVSVLFSHAYDLSGRAGEEPLRQLISVPVSFIGVRIFFVISGFLIAGSLEYSSSGYSFLFRRILRIFPGLAVALLFCSFVIGPALTTYPMGRYFLERRTYSFFVNILLCRSQPWLPGVFEHNLLRTVNGSLWTLVYEFACYGMILCFRKVFQNRIAPFVLILAFMGIIASVLLAKSDWYGRYILPLNMSPKFFVELSTYFWCGALLYWYNARIGCLFKNRVVVAVLLAVTLILSSASLVWLYLFVSLAVAAAGVKQSRFSGFSRYGDLTYGLYIYSFPVQQSVLAFCPGMGVGRLLLTTLLLTLPLAWLSWTFVEFPAIRLGKRQPAGTRNSQKATAGML